MIMPTSIKKLKENTNLFLSDIDKIIKNFEDKGDPKELNSKIKKEIIKFQKNLE